MNIRTSEWKLLITVLMMADVTKTLRIYDSEKGKHKS